LTGDADDKSGKIALQPTDYFEQIKKTNGHAKRNILAIQQEMLASVSSSPAPENKENKPKIPKPTAPRPRCLTCKQAQLQRSAAITLW
jgi:hypothetical protein